MLLKFLLQWKQWARLLCELTVASISSQRGQRKNFWRAVRVSGLIPISSCENQPAHAGRSPRILI